MPCCSSGAPVHAPPSQSAPGPSQTALVVSEVKKWSLYFIQYTTSEKYLVGMKKYTTGNIFKKNNTEYL